MIKPKDIKRFSKRVHEELRYILDDEKRQTIEDSFQGTDMFEKEFIALHKDNMYVDILNTWYKSAHILIDVSKLEEYKYTFFDQEDTYI